MSPQAQELEEFCFKFSLNHMTAVTQTEAFVKLDEGTVKDFITKVLRYFQHYTLPRLHKVEPSSRDDGEGGGLTQNRNCKMERTGTLLSERMYYQGPQGSLYFLSPPRAATYSTVL